MRNLLFSWEAKMAILNQLFKNISHLELRAITGRRIHIGWDSGGKLLKDNWCPGIHKSWVGRWKEESGQVQWLTPVIPALWEANVGRSPEVRNLRPAWPTWWNLTSTKNTKTSQAPVIPATQEERIPWTWEAEVAISWNRATALQSGRQETSSQTNKKRLTALSQKGLAED